MIIAHDPVRRDHIHSAPDTLVPLSYIINDLWPKLGFLPIEPESPGVALIAEFMLNELILKNVEYRWTEYTLYCLYLGLIKKNITKLYKRKTLPINNALWDFSNDSKVMTNHIKNKVCKDNKKMIARLLDI